MVLEELQLLDSQITRLDQAMAELLCPYQDQVHRLADDDAHAERVVYGVRDVADQ